MTEYMLTVHGVEGAPTPSPEVRERMFADVGAFNKEAQEAGIWVFAGGLHPPHTATVVRAEGDDFVVTDGPFSEAKEHVGGFWVFRVADLDEALRWARKATVACQSPVEVRPFQAV
ncbi:MAG: YciI family protein [Myxococcota bacterium]